MQTFEGIHTSNLLHSGLPWQAEYGDACVQVAMCWDWYTPCTEKYKNDETDIKVWATNDS